jgi:hypothetical protein
MTNDEQSIDVLHFYSTKHYAVALLTPTQERHLEEMTISLFIDQKCESRGWANVLCISVY